MGQFLFSRVLMTSVCVDAESALFESHSLRVLDQRANGGKRPMSVKSAIGSSSRHDMHRIQPNDYCKGCLHFIECISYVERSSLPEANEPAIRLFDKFVRSMTVIPARQN